MATVDGRTLGEVDVGACTDVGRVRGSNEDAWLVLHSREAAQPASILLAVLGFRSSCHARANGPSFGAALA